MLRGESDAVTGLKNKIQTTVASIAPSESRASSIARWPTLAR
jgi:hypothetical protein